MIAYVESTGHVVFEFRLGGFVHSGRERVSFHPHYGWVIQRAPCRPVLDEADTELATPPDILEEAEITGAAEVNDWLLANFEEVCAVLQRYPPRPTALAKPIPEPDPEETPC